MTIDKFNFAGKKAIVRVDFNVPLDENGKITDDTRIRGALPTLKKVLADGGSLIIMSHMGKPKGKVNAKYSLSQIVDAVSEKLGVPVQFAPDCAKAGDAAAALKPGEVLLLENLRFYPEEEGKPVGIDKEDPAYEDAKKAMKASQKEFAKTLASYADCYINDAFGTAHRKHASTAVIADYFDADNKMLGYLMEKEVQAVDNILKDIAHGFYGADPAGIWQPVKLSITNPVKVKDVFIKPTLEGATFDLTVKNHDTKKKQFDLYTDIIDKETGATFYTALSLPKLVLKANKEKIFT